MAIINSQITFQDGRGQRGREDESGSVRSHHVDQVLATGDVASDVAKGLSKGARDDVHLIKDSVAFANSRSVIAVKSNGVHFVHEGQGSIVVREIAQLLQRRNGSRHGVDGFKGHNLGDVGVDLPQELLKVFGVVVAVDVLGHTAVPDALDHRGVVARVGKDVAT